jgi:preprotein translocase SecF subunit
LGWDAFKALGFAALAVAAYIWIRFEWQFGVGALFALFHDVSLTLGLFAITGMEFDLNIVAALLTLIGYSLNDTIVVYDRIRENMKKFRKMPMPELLDLSVNETLARTIVTSLSILITLAALLLLGPGCHLRLYCCNYAGHFCRYIQLDLYGCADPDLAESQSEQFCAHRNSIGKTGAAGPRRRLILH